MQPQRTALLSKGAPLGSRKRPTCLRIPTLLFLCVVPPIVIILHASSPAALRFLHHSSFPLGHKGSAGNPLNLKRPFFSPAVLSQLSAYSDHYQAPATNFSSSETLSSLRSILTLADETLPAFRSTVEVNHGFTVDALHATTGYTLLETPLNPFCPGSLSRIPRNLPTDPPCLSVITNAFIGLDGVVLQPHKETIYDLAGGCCSDSDWKRHLNSKITLSESHLATMRPGRIVLNLGQHHGTTYHHVIHEVLPRYLSMIPLIEATELVVLIANSTVSPLLLCEVLGLPPEKLKIQPYQKSMGDNWFYASVVLIPPSIYEQQHQNIYPSGIVHTTAAVLRDLATMKSKLSSRGSKKRLVLIERALKRKADGSCQEKRCIKNFDELRRGLEAKFADTYDLMIYKADATVDTAVRTFSLADVIVGFHGAGFQNIMFCREGVTVVHIGYDNQYEDLADECKLRYHLSKAQGTSWGMKSIVLDVGGVILDVEKAIQEDEVWRSEGKSVNNTTS